MKSETEIIDELIRLKEYVLPSLNTDVGREVCQGKIEHIEWILDNEGE